MAQGSFSTNPTRSEQLLFLTDDQLRQGIELMFFAYRGFTADPDRILAERQYGRAHHRAIHFINRRPGLTVNELLDFLGVTKQSLNRVLRQLVDDGLVESRVGVEDRRHRNLHLTAAGRQLEQELSAAQRRRMRAAFSTAGPDAVHGFRKVLEQMIDPEFRDRVLGCRTSSPSTTTRGSGRCYRSSSPATASWSPAPATRRMPGACSRGSSST
jgi:DNA-binding MarR family transcriptional regulator